VFATRKGRCAVAVSVGQLLKTEEDCGLFGGEVYANFRRNVEQTRTDLLALLLNAKQNGQSVAGKSCPGRCVTLLNYVGVGPHLLPYIAEQPTSLKLGMYVPGVHIPVVEDAVLLKEQPDYVILLAWHYGPPIGRLLREMGLKSRLVMPLPQVTVWEGRVPN
jgi:hypothetical protein